ncbi:hypothetical protein GIB67_035316 [Kingdonia uniflora]|uniref:Plasma membrane-associated cation-binding protein 1 n=1 Tax=Kingdonia uniflora TaxID=39325 RepID=A0A7J7KXZ2_9MAGN|nr:hypothetical protein GIB67_035316 [Kingdonia uniflora]
MNYWKAKVLPKINKFLEKKSTKKVAAAEACKTFDDSKEDISKEFEEKKTELQTKVLEIYEASSTGIKTCVKERKDEGIKKNSAAVTKFLEELVKIDFPGSKPVYEASTKFGPTLVSSPIFFLFEKISTYVVIVDKEVEVPPPTTEETSGKEKEVVEIEEKKEEEEIKVPVEEVVVPEPVPAPCEPTKVVEADPPKP